MNSSGAAVNMQNGGAMGGATTGTVVTVAATACAVWYGFIALVQAIGFTQLFRHYSSKPKPAAVLKLPEYEIPHLTIIRPVKGLEPQLYECLAATFSQTYPRSKLTIYFCVAEASDPAYPTLLRLLADFPSFDARIFIEAEDPNLSTYDGASGLERNLGPNPKIRNMSRAYKEAKSDIVWIMDSNVWISPGVAGRMVDKLCGYRLTASGSVTVTKPFKFVHQLPLVVDSVGASAGEEARGLLQHSDVDAAETAPSDGSSINADRHGVLKTGGGRLEEMFMAGSHAKFYTAINTVAVAPCIVGKSNMFRRSHLDALTQPDPQDATGYAPGIDYFSDNICEDHLIGDLLWRKKVPAELGGERFGRHALVFGDVAVQPMKGMGIREYTARRVRWLRVRKWTVLLATLVEPGVESLLCSAYGAFAATTLPVLREALGFKGTWGEFGIVWAGSVLAWCAMDWLTFQKLHRMSTVELDAETPSFARPPPGGRRRPFGEWVAAWVGREVLALPIWTYAVLGGTTVKWRNREFKVGMDMKVREVTREGQYKGGYGINAMKAMNGNGKARRD